MDSNDENDLLEEGFAKTDDLKEKIRLLGEKKQQYERIQKQMNASGQREVTLVDPDSRLVREWTD